MCGIIGYTGSKPATSILMAGLSRLEYRGYDGAGIAVMDSMGETNVLKSSGKLDQLKEALKKTELDGTTGIGHTRWATHGGPTHENAHPHTDCKNEVAVVHNGIVENFMDLRRELEGSGHIFSSQTDSECISHLIEVQLAQGDSLESAARKTALRIKGAHAVLVTAKQEPDSLVAFRLGHAGGIVVGYQEGEMLVASDLSVLIPHTKRVVYLEGGELLLATPSGAQYTNLSGDMISKEPIAVTEDSVSVGKGEYDHFMLKEIYEQPEVAISAMGGRVLFDKTTVDFNDFLLSEQEILNINKVVLLGMGTSLHAAMVGRHWIESLARIPSEYDNSSEFRYRDPIIDENTLVVSVCQSGETADTLAAMTKAASLGARQITLSNYEGTQATRIAESTILIRAGTEIGVAASKTFTSSLVSLYVMAIHLAMKRGTLSDQQLRKMVKELSKLPAMLGSLLVDQQRYKQLATGFGNHSNFLFLGRGIHYPMAMEGALKLKEISYIHAEGYPAGEMKHGPISLIDDDMPIVALLPNGGLYQKTLGNVKEVQARGGRVIAVASQDNREIADLVDEVIYIPKASTEISPILLAVPIQLLAYHMAVRKGCDVDQPRNLAKSVTVE